MKSLDFGRHALGGFAVAAMLAGCGGAQPPISAPGSMPQSRAIARQAERGGSWMLREAKSHDLLYASDNLSNEVFVFTYPRAKLVGTLTSFDSPVGVCVDKASNVWIVNGSPPEVIEYPHGGTTPIATLIVPYGAPVGCAIDPTTGNLAVIGTSNDISVFPNAQNPPTNYTAAGFLGLEYGGYDDRGNLFSVGYYGQEPSGRDALAELPSGGSSVVPVAFNQDIKANVVQWDGQYLSVGGQNYKKQPVPVYRVIVSGNQASIVNKIYLKSHPQSTVWQQFWIQGPNIIQCYGRVNDQSLGVWHYFRGGYPDNKIKGFGGRSIWGVTVSVAPSH